MRSMTRAVLVLASLGVAACAVDGKPPPLGTAGVAEQPNPFTLDWQAGAPYVAARVPGARADLSSPQLQNYATAPAPKAMAIGLQNQRIVTARGTSIEEARRRALETCAYLNRAPCVLYAENDALVAPSQPLNVTDPGPHRRVLGVPPSQYAASAVPFVSDMTRGGAPTEYARRTGGRALVVTTGGSAFVEAGYADTPTGAAEAAAVAMRRCTEAVRQTNSQCLLWAVGDRVAYRPPGT